jgi:hypothetical protein
MAEGRPSGRLLSVNVGLPQDVPWHGRTVHGGVEEPGRRGRGWPAADEGGAIYAGADAQR